MASILKPDTSVVVGVSTAALVGFIYSYGVPNLSVIGATEAEDMNIDAGRKKAAWTGAAAVAILSLLTRDKTVFVIGGATLVALDWTTRHANATAPDQRAVSTAPAFPDPVDTTPDVQPVPQQTDEFGYGY